MNTTLTVNGTDGGMRHNGKKLFTVNRGATLNLNGGEYIASEYVVEVDATSTNTKGTANITGATLRAAKLTDGVPSYGMDNFDAVNVRGGTVNIVGSDLWAYENTLNLYAADSTVNFSSGTINSTAGSDSRFAVRLGLKTASSS